jgi:WD domain, G-beta repeat
MRRAGDHACLGGPDAVRIRTTGFGGAARVWDSVTGEQLLELSGYLGGVSDGAFSPDGSRVLTVGRDRTLRVWDAVTGDQVPWQLEDLPDGQVAVWSAPERELLGATPEAWRWLGWGELVDGVRSRLPAETYGDLPRLEDIPACRALLEGPRA